MAEFLYDVEIPSMHAGSKHQVHVTHINDPSWFFVCPSKLVTFVQKFEGLSNTKRRIQYEEVELGRRVSYHSSTSGNIIRGKIVAINGFRENVTCDLQAGDYGWIDEGAAVNDIYISQKPGEAAPITAIQCGLDNCYPVGERFDENANEVMRRYINNDEVLMTVKSVDFARSKVMVDLQSPTAADDLATVLEYMGVAVRQPPADFVDNSDNSY